MVKMTDAAAIKLSTWSDWLKLDKEVKRYINEGNDYFSVAVGGFTLTFDRNNTNTNKRGRDGIKR